MLKNVQKIRRISNMNREELKYHLSSLSKSNFKNANLKELNKSKKEKICLHSLSHVRKYEN